MKYNHSWAVKWMQQRNGGANGGSICICSICTSMDLSTYNNYIKHKIDVFYSLYYLQTNLKYNHTWAIQWMQHWSSNANGSSICIPIDLSTDDTFKVPISTVSCVGGYLIIPWWQWVNTICGHLVFLYGHYITIFSIVAETKFPSFQFCLVLRCASKLCIIINVS
jgi:hypothetical protein